jgi:hypothetical protein
VLPTLLTYPLDSPAGSSLSSHRTRHGGRLGDGDRALVIPGKAGIHFLFDLDTFIPPLSHELEIKPQETDGCLNDGCVIALVIDRQKP